MYKIATLLLTMILLTPMQIYGEDLHWIDDYCEFYIPDGNFIAQPPQSQQSPQQLNTTNNITFDVSKSSNLTEKDFEAIMPEGLKCIAHALFVADNNGVNGLLLGAIACVESGNGTSDIATVKKNVLGWNAYNGMASASRFESYEDCIFSCYPLIAKNYLREDGKYYHGKTIAGINVKYSANKNWKNLVSKKMKELTATYNKEISE